MVVFIVIAILILCLIATCIYFGRRTKRRNRKIEWWALTHIAFALPLLFVVLLIALGSTKPYAEGAVLFIGYAFVSAFLWAVIFRSVRSRRFFIPFLCGLLCFAVGCGVFYGKWSYENSLAKVSEPAGLLWKYDPTNDENALAVLEEPSTLSLTDDLPQLDGATALYPVYAAFANAVYPEEAFNPPESSDTYFDTNAWIDFENKYGNLLECSTTTWAYERLVDGETDIIFVAGPSDAQLQYAADKGEEMIFTPIGREAFVFFVNAQNPVNSLTMDQIRSIYSGETKNWKELGADLGKIRPFQRDEGSGSQSALVRFMGETPLMEPEKENVIAGMGGIIEKTADYRNYPAAIGYSFRFYSTEMVRNGEIKLLEINGIAPTKENILNDSYPIASEFYAVHLASNDNPSIQPMLDWILSAQGQSLIDQTGYVSLE